MVIRYPKSLCIQNTTRVYQKNDIAILILKEDVPANVAAPGKVYMSGYTEKAQVKAAGFGTTKPGDPMGHSDVLMEASLDLGPEQYCIGTNDNFFPDNMVCTRGRSDRGTCWGDEGGPLAIKTNSSRNQWGLFGLYIFKYGTTDPSGNRPAYPGSVTYFTHVAPYVDWIAKEANL